MLIRFAAGVYLGIIPACGAQVDDGGITGSLGIGGSTSATGGNTSVSIGATVGGTSTSTGGSTAVAASTICSGMFAGFCGVQQFVNVSSCDIPLQGSPNAASVKVAVDCQYVAQVKLDAGTADGYYIDYSYSPAHLELTGSVCANTSTHGVQSVVLVPGCVY